MLVSPSRQGADYNFHQDRKATRSERYQTYELYGQARELSLRHSNSAHNQQLAKEITSSIKRGVPLETTPAELLLTDREKVRGHERLGHSTSAQQIAEKLTDGIRQSKSLNDLWSRADAFEQDGAEELQKEALRKLSNSPLIDLNELLMNALRKKQTHNVKPLIELGAKPDLLLKLAAIQGKTELIEPLLEAGAQVNHKNRLGWNATTLAALAKQSQSVKRLREKNGYNDLPRILAEEIAPSVLEGSEKEIKLATKKLSGEIPLGVYFKRTDTKKSDEAAPSLDLQA